MFFDYMFSFLRRKTDFFQNMKQAETTIANAGKKHITEYMKDKQEKDSKEAEQKKRDAEKAALR